MTKYTVVRGQLGPASGDVPKQVRQRIAAPTSMIVRRAGRFILLPAGMNQASSACLTGREVIAGQDKQSKP
jgi:hypothetical protein